MSETVGGYTQAVVIVLTALLVGYEVVTNAPDLATRLGVIVAASGSILALVQSRITHAAVKDVSDQVGAGK